jgi:hypothetical protein
MTAAAVDYDEIVRVVQLYVDGVNDSDVDKLREAFHEDAWIFYTDAGGALHKDLLTNCFEDWTAPLFPKGVVGRVISVSQAGDAACVLLGFDRPEDLSDSYVDIHSLLRVDGVWKIMNKTATHSSRADWAAPEPSRHQAGVSTAGG